MKHLYSLLGAALCALSAHAAHLTPSEALSRLSSSSPGLPMRMAPAKDLKLVLTAPGCYVYNQPGGFMVLAADDAGAPLLGYSDSGEFDPDNIPPQLQYWLDAYAEQMAAATMPYQAPVWPDWASIEPLCKTRWDQNAPYNDLCPTVSVGGTQVRTVTGCVATAMAQVMKYFNYPETGTGTHSYTWTDQNNVDHAMSIDFSTVHFNWADMLDIYPYNGYTTAQGNAVAELMKACGYGVDMNYATASVGGSGSYSAAVVRCLRENLDYDARLVYRAYYDMMEWAGMIYDNLAHTGPIQYSGQGTGGGHSFVVDGYSHSGFFHLNWGWGGLSDGYFLLNALNPSAMGTGGGSGGGFNLSQEAILGVKPRHGAAAEANPAVLGVSELSNAYFSGSNLYIIGQFVNIGGEGPLSPGIEVYDSDGELVTSKIYTTYENFPLNSYLPRLIFNLGSLPEGDYKVVISYRNDDGTYSPAQAKLGTFNYVDIHIGDHNSAAIPHEEPLQITDFALLSPVYLGAGLEVSGNVTNPNPRENIRTLVLAFFDSETSTSAVARVETVALDIAGGETQSLAYRGDMQSEGSLTGGTTYYLAWCERSNTGALTVISERIPVEVRANDGYSIDVQNLRVNRATAWGVNISYDIRNTTGYYASQPVFIVYQPVGTQYNMLTQLYCPFSFLDASNAWTVMDEVWLPTDVFTVGEQYVAGLFVVQNNAWTQKGSTVSFTVSNLTGLDAPQGAEEGDAQYYDLQGRRIARPASGLCIRVQDSRARKVIL